MTLLQFVYDTNFLFQYSNTRNKLYVGKDIPSPINFSTRIPMNDLDDVYIRAMALFSSADQASERVQRCINHSMDDINKSMLYGILNWLVICKYQLLFVNV